ncbi:MAG: glycosyltransferase [Candidatus Thermoplasmatota archaeon]|nr:glycosyltransferase [Candidatus Thermoplasmatota archaeon]
MTKTIGDDCFENVDVTFCLVSLNEERSIRASLGAIIRESKGFARAEILVMAGGTDDTYDIAVSMLSDVKDAIVIEDAEPKGKPAALNTLFSMAHGKILILSDGDVILGAGSARKLVDSFNNVGIGCASGRVIGAQDRPTPVTRSCRLMNEMMHAARSRDFADRGTIELASGYLIAIRRELVPVLPHSINSDDGFLSRSVRSQKKTIVYVEDAIVTINFPLTMQDFMKQKVRTRVGHLELRRWFDADANRNIFTEMKEYTRALRSGTISDIDIVSILGATVLSISVWILVYLRIHVPFLFGHKVWTPVLSTK